MASQKRAPATLGSPHVLDPEKITTLDDVRVVLGALGIHFTPSILPEEQRKALMPYLKPMSTGTK